MPTDKATPDPRGAGRFAAIAAIVVALAIIATFVGMNMQHAKDMRDEQSGIVKPSAVPMTEKDLGKTPVRQK